MLVYCSQETKSSQPATRGGTFENSKYQKNNNEQGSSDAAYAGGYNRADAASQPSQSTGQVYRPPHMQNRVNVPK